MKYFLLLLFLIPTMALAQTDFEKGETLFNKGKFTASQPFFESVVKQSPDNFKALEFLGDIQGHLGNWDNAISYYEKLKQLKPKEANYYYKYGGALGMKAKESNKIKALSMLNDIKHSFEKAITLNPKHIEARWALIELYLQLPGIVGGSEKKANKYAAELMKISPVDGYLSKGRIEEYFKRYKEAEKEYKLAVALTGSKMTYQKLADLYKNKMNQPDKAKSILEDFEKRKG